MNHFKQNLTSSIDPQDQEQGSISVSEEDGEKIIKKSRLQFLVDQDNLNPVRMVMAEMVGSFILMFCVCGIIASTQIMRGEVGLMEYAATAGLTVVVIIFCFGPISGAHVNPAMTLAFAIFGHFPWSRVPVYVLAQTGGSALATWAGWLIYGVKPELMATRPANGCVSCAFWVELIATFMVMFLAASVTCGPQSIGNLSGIVIGMAIALAVLITGPVSGGSMNPARSLGPAIVAWNFKDIWIYLTAPVLGSVLGALFFHFLKLAHKKPQPRAQLPQPCSSSSISSPDDSTLLTHSLAFTTKMDHDSIVFA